MAQLNINLKSQIKIIPSYSGVYKKYPTKKNKLQFTLWFLFFEIEFKNR